MSTSESGRGEEYPGFEEHRLAAQAVALYRGDDELTRLLTAAAGNLRVHAGSPEPASKEELAAISRVCDRAADALRAARDTEQRLRKALEWLDEHAGLLHPDAHARVSLRKALEWLDEHAGLLHPDAHARVSRALATTEDSRTEGSSVRDVSPDAYFMAHHLVRFIDPSRPQLHRTLPPWTG